VIQKSQTFQKPKKTDTACDVPAVQKGRERIFLSLLVVLLQKYQIRKNQRKLLEERSLY